MWPLDVPPYRTLLKYANKKKKSVSDFTNEKLPEHIKFLMCVLVNSGQIYFVSSQYIQWRQNKNVEFKYLNILLLSRWSDCFYCSPHLYVTLDKSVC